MSEFQIVYRYTPTTTAICTS